MGMAPIDIPSKTARMMGDGKRVDFVEASTVQLYRLGHDDDKLYIKVSDGFGLENPVCSLAVLPGDKRAYFFRPIAKIGGAEFQIIGDDGQADLLNHDEIFTM